MQLIGNGRLITWHKTKPYIEDGCVAFEGDTIVDFGTTADIRPAYPDADFYDAKGRVIMPGLINAHTHIYSSFARGLNFSQREPDRDFSDILKNKWWHIDKVLNHADNRYSAYATGLESVRYGVTTIFDHHASQRHVMGSLRTLSDALCDIGLRSCLCYEVSDRDGEGTAEEGIAENISFIDYAKKSDNPLIAGMFGLHASFTLSEATLQKCVGAMGTRTAGYHIHAAEGVVDLYDSLAKYGKRVIPRLFDAGILGDKTLCIHNIHINAAEMDMLRQTNTMAVHNPQSNMGNAVGCTPILQLLSRGILLGLGTDGYTQDMFESLKTANIIHKHVLCNPNIGFLESMEMLFSGNTAICSRFFEKPLGIISPGAYADIIVADYNPHTPMSAQNIAGHLMFGMMGRAVDTTVIGGQFVMRERVMQTVDEAELLAECRAQSSDFWARLNP